MTLQEQFHTIAAMIVCGLLMGTAFDIVRVCSRAFRFPRPLVMLLDLAYWGTALWAVFRTLLEFNHGQLRFFVFLGLGIGICGYFALFSPWVVRIVRELIRWIQALVRLLLRLFHALIIVPIVLLARLLWVLGRFLVTVTMFFLKIMLQLSYPLRVLALWLLRPLLRRLPLAAWKRGLLAAWRRTQAFWRKWTSRIANGFKRLF